MFEICLFVHLNFFIGIYQSFQVDKCFFYLVHFGRIHRPFVFGLWLSPNHVRLWLIGTDSWLRDLAWLASRVLSDFLFATIFIVLVDWLLLFFVSFGERVRFIIDALAIWCFFLIATH